jgi:hypothetical protein
MNRAGRNYWGLTAGTKYVFSRPVNISSVFNGLRHLFRVFLAWEAVLFDCSKSNWGIGLIQIHLHNTPPVSWPECAFKHCLERSWRLWGVFSRVFCSYDPRIKKHLPPPAGSHREHAFWNLFGWAGV